MTLFWGWVDPTVCLVMLTETGFPVSVRDIKRSQHLLVLIPARVASWPTNGFAAWCAKCSTNVVAQSAITMCNVRWDDVG